MGYAKLFSSITESSLWDESKETRILFVSLLARADAAGFVEASIPGLARLSNLTKEEVKASLEVLSSPDPYSKDKEHEGRRITPVDGGWIILNYEKHRQKRSEEERREYMREYMRKYRSKDNPVNQNVNNCKQSKPPLAQAEAEAEAEAVRNTHMSKSLRDSDDVRMVYEGYIQAVGKNSNQYQLTPERKRWIRERMANFSTEQLVEAAKRFSKDPWEERKRFIGMEYLYRKHSQTERWVHFKTPDQERDEAVDRIMGQNGKGVSHG